MTKLFIDTEFNGYKGDLLSVGIISECGKEFYRVLHGYGLVYSKWVSDNVLPVLIEPPCTLPSLREALQSYLMQFEEIHVIADWPEDISYFCNVLVEADGKRIDTPPLTMEIRRDIDSLGSTMPHNALHDAKAIMKMYFNVTGAYL